MKCPLCQGTVFRNYKVPGVVYKCDGCKKALCMTGAGELVLVKEFNALDNKAFEKKLRDDVICCSCHYHTVQKLTDKGWQCIECGTIQEEVKNEHHS